MDQPPSKLHLARLALFARGVRRGHLTLDEVEAALPAGTLTTAERWLLHYSLNALGVELLLEGQPLQPISESA